MSSMFPGFVDSVKEGWNKLTGKKEIDNEDTDDETPESTEVSEPPVTLPPLPIANSLPGEISLIGAEGLLHSTQKAKKSLEEYEAARKKLLTCTDLMSAIRDATKDDGTVEIKAAKLKRLLKDASLIGVRVPQNKTQLSRDERENLKHEIDGKVADINHDIQMCSHKISKCQQDHTSLLVELKKLWDQYNEIIRTFNRNIVSR